MKKWVSCFLASLVCLGSVAYAQDANRTLSPEQPVVVAVTTQISGYLFSQMWGVNEADASLRSMIHGYSTMVWKPDGTCTADPAVVTALTAKDDARGNRTYTVTLAKDLTYNNGDAITAADYVFSILLRSDPAIAELGGMNAAYAYVSGFMAYHDKRANVLSGVRLLSPYQFSIQVPASELPYYYELTYVDVQPAPIQVIAPNHTVRDDGMGAYLAIANNAQQSGYLPTMLTTELLSQTLTAKDGYLFQPKVTCGAYQLKSINVEKGGASFALNPLYKGNYDGRKPEVAQVNVVWLSSDDALTAYEIGEVQIIHKLTNSDAVALARQLQNEGKAIVSSYLDPGYAFLSFACEQVPTDDAGVRLAISMCLDRNAFCQQLFRGNALPVYGYYGYGQWMASQNSEQLGIYDPGFDYDTANVLLSQAGFTYNEQGEAYQADRDQIRCKVKDGILIPLELRWAKTNSKAADLVQEQLTTAAKHIGMRLISDETSFADMLTQYYRVNGERDHNLFFLSENFSYVFDPYLNYQIGESWQGIYNTTGLTDDLLTKAARSMRHIEPGDNESFLKKWFAFQDRWHMLMPTAPIYSNVLSDVSEPTLYEYPAYASYGLATALLYTTYTQPSATTIIVALPTPAVDATQTDQP